MSEEYIKLKARLLNRSKWNGDCLESTYKPKSQSGYALVKFRKSTIGAHRASWLCYKGKIPEGMQVCHHCDNPLCININHLFLGFPKDNTKDMIQKRRHNFFGKKKYSDEISNQAIELRKQGLTYKEISEKMKIPINNLNNIFRRESNKENVKEFYGVPKYPEEVRKEAFRLRSIGIKCEIQKILGIPKRSLTRIFKNN